MEMLNTTPPMLNTTPPSSVGTSKKLTEPIYGKRHPCSYCEKSFGQKTDLTRHVMIHTGEKPFICRICSKGFTRNEKLKYHMYARHKHEMGS